MKKYIFVFVLLLISFHCFSQRNQRNQSLPSALPDALQNGNSAAINLGGFIGERLDVCIKNRMNTQDVNHLVQPFFKQNERTLWHTCFWGIWSLGATLSYQYTQDRTLFDSIQSGVDGLLRAQLPNGYIGNYTEEAQLQHWDIMGRKYVLLGLLAHYDMTGDRKVLDAARRAADHLITQVKSSSINVFASGMYVGMPSSGVLEPMVFLYQRTGDARYLDFAEYIVAQWETDGGPKLISKAEADIPVAERFPHPRWWWSEHNGGKAYEMMSCYDGLLALYKITQNPLYLTAIEKTVQSIIDTEINIAGSGSAFECWYHGKARQTEPTFHTMENCVTTTWMNLCHHLLRFTGKSIYADQLEITAYNALFSSLKDDGTEITKYVPLGGKRNGSGGQCGMDIHCCSANGPRGFALLPQIALMHAEREIYVNLYTNFDANVDLDNRTKVTVKQQTTYPVEGEVVIHVETARPEKFTVALRIPAWSKENSVSVNGEKLDGIVAGDYFKIDRTWRKGDVITLHLDVRGRIVKNTGHAAIMRGPVALARDTRFGDGFVDETARFVENDGYVELTPVANKPSGMWMAFTAPLLVGVEPEGEAGKPRQVHFCDFASAGNNWQYSAYYRVWIKEQLNVMATPYVPY